jgi:hypothetical protein
MDAAGQLMARRMLLALHAQVALSAGCSGRPSPPRKVRFWLSGNHVGPGAPPGNGTAAPGHCKPYLIANLTRYQHAIDSLGVFAYGVRNGTITDDGMTDPGFWPCIRQIKREFPHISIGLAGGGPDDQFINISHHPKEFGETVWAWVQSHDGLIDELWTDFEPSWQGTGLLAPNASDLDMKPCTPASRTTRCEMLRGINAAHEAMQSVLPTFAYVCCGNYSKSTSPTFGFPGAWTESCAEFANAAPGVTIQASNTYRDDTVSSGEFGGFERLLEQEIADITANGRFPENLKRLSPAICPDCTSPTGNNSATDLTMEQLYTRADIACDHGVVDWSGFTLLEIAKAARSATLGHRYMEALAYFRTGQKGQIPTSTSTSTSTGEIAPAPKSDDRHVDGAPLWYVPPSGEYVRVGTDLSSCIFLQPGLNGIYHIYVPICTAELTCFTYSPE